MHYLLKHSGSTTQVIYLGKSFQTDCQIKISELYHLLTKRFIHQRTVRISKECAIVMLFTQP